jgi:hypothetical protein
MVRTMVAAGLMLVAGASLAFAAPDSSECGRLTDMHLVASALQEATHELVQGCDTCDSSVKDTATHTAEQLMDDLNEASKAECQ